MNEIFKMSVRRSTENLSVIPPQASSSGQNTSITTFSSICEICRNSITVKAHALKANCNHYFHKSCFSKFTQNKSNCPTCNTQFILPKTSNPKTPQHSGLTMTTRNQARQQQADENRQTNESINRPSTPNTPRSSNSSPRSNEQQRHYIRNLVTAAVGAQQAQMLSSLSEQLTQLIQTNIEAGFRRLNLNNTENQTSAPTIEANNITNDNNDYPRSSHGQGLENQTLNQLLGLAQNNNQDNFVNFNIDPSPGNLLRINSGLSGDLAVRPDKISQIISNWKLKYSGTSSGLPIDLFIYRVEALTNQTLGGNFDLLCRNASVLFEGKACDWYWRYHKTVRDIKWPDLCASLRR